MKAFASVLVVLSLTLSWGANHYVRPGASGNGSDWTNAYGSLPPVLVRGDTYYIADGNYGSYSFDDPVSGSQVITIKKATIADHGTDAGWSDTFGDGQARFGGISFAVGCGYYELNGQTRNENDWQEADSYGIAINSNGYGMFIPERVNSLTFKYIDLYSGSVAVKMTLASVPYRTNLYFGYMHVHNYLGQGMAFHSANNEKVTIEYCHIGPTHGKETIRHWRGQHWIIRYNKFIDDCVLPSSEACTAGIGIFTHGTDDLDAHNWELYGNVFAGTGKFVAERANGMILASTSRNWKFYHNTIHNVDGNWAGAVKLGSGSQVFNNIWHKMGDYDETYGSLISAPAGTDRSWCFYDNPKPTKLNANCSALPGIVYDGTEDPFNNAAALDFRLKASFTGISPLDKAAPLAAPYNVDANGVQHDNIGAFATIGEGGTPVVPAHELNSGSGSGLGVIFNEWPNPISTEMLACLVQTIKVRLYTLDGTQVKNGQICKNGIYMVKSADGREIHKVMVVE